VNVASSPVVPTLRKPRSVGQPSFIMVQTDQAEVGQPPDIEKRVREIQMSDIIERVKEIQAQMAESAQSRFDESELGHLRCLMRLAVEFHDYLEHGSVEIAASILHGPHAKYVRDVQSASIDPFNKYDLEFLCDSIRSGVNSFCILNASYKMLDGATDSKIEWSMISSRKLFKANFVSMFNQFTEDVNFANRSRLLLDMFKLQIVFAGISYGGLAHL
jgi:hypothetical protein